MIKGATYRLRAFLSGPLYPIFVGVLVLISHVFAIEAVVAPLIADSCMLILFLFDSLEYTIAPIAVFVYLLSREHTPSAPVYSGYLSEPLQLAVIILICAGLLLSILYFFSKNKRYRNISFSRNSVFRFLLVFCLMLFVSAIFSGENTVKNLVFATLQSSALVIPFLLFGFGIPRERTENAVNYLCYSAFISSSVIILELLHLYFTENIFLNGMLVKEKITLGWGIWNSVGGMLVMVIPLLFLGAVRSAHTVTYLTCAALSYLFSVLTLSRNALLVGTLIFVICTVACALFGDKKKIFRRFLLGLICIIGVFLLVYGSRIAEILSDYINRGFSDNGRFALWEASISAFLDNVLFGSGFHGYGGEYFQFASFMPPLPHNTLLAVLGGGGLLLTAAYIAYRVFTVLPFLKKPCLSKTLLGLCALALVLGSLLDNFIFNFYPTFLYTASICMAIGAD